MFKIEGVLVGFFDGLAEDGMTVDDEVGIKLRILLGLSVGTAVEVMVDVVLGFKELDSEGPWLGKWLGLTVDIRLGSTIGAELEDSRGTEDGVIVGLGEKLVCTIAITALGSGDGILLVNGDGINVGSTDRFRLYGT